ncbi:MAG TPA: menaquinone biosynthesis decarboxylase [Deltaproteobacteria bacterium]|nr:MAG: menaquinone biosynthesis decarboxylase [bacterium]HDH10387.1 menaquinone biosynthesis decarboxylase [Deltaproteobacteria bacterium]
MDLHQYLDILDKKNDLAVIDAAASVNQEIPYIASETVKKGGKALLFKNPSGYKIPVAMNLFGSRERMSIIMRGNLEHQAERIRELLSFSPPSGMLDKMRMAYKLKKLADFTPKMVSRADFKQIHKDNIKDIPVTTSWPLDGGAFVTLPLVITKNPITGKLNCGMYRMQIYDNRTTGMHWQIHKNGASHFAIAKKMGKDKIDVAVALGGDPILTYTATAPLPEDTGEFLFAGFLRNEAVRLVQCENSDLAVPASSEIVIEGEVSLNDLREEGPFGDHTGYYSWKDKYPVFRIKAVYRKKDAIYPATVVGKPIMEDAFLGLTTERLFLPMLQKIIPEIVDLHLPPYGLFHNLAFVSIKKRFPGQARKVAYGLWGMGMLSLTKMIVVLDEDVDIHNINEVIWRIGNNSDPVRDSFFLKGPLDALENASENALYGGKMGLDATKKLPEEGLSRFIPPEVKPDKSIAKLVQKRWKEYKIGLK